MTSRPVTIIAPSRRLALPRLSEVGRRRELLAFLAWRDISARYRQSVLGVLWAVIQPLAMMAAFTLVFDQVAGVETGDTPYALVALSGLVVWQLYSRTATRLHGLVLALKNGVPVVPIDPRPGGGKIMRQADTVGWPIAFCVDRLDPDQLRAAFDHCLTAEAREQTLRLTPLVRAGLDQIRLEFVAGVRNQQWRVDEGLRDESRRRLFSRLEEPGRRRRWPPGRRRRA